MHIFDAIATKNILGCSFHAALELEHLQLPWRFLLLGNPRTKSLLHPKCTFLGTKSSLTHLGSNKSDASLYIGHFCSVCSEWVGGWKCRQVWGMNKIRVISMGREMKTVLDTQGVITCNSIWLRGHYKKTPFPSLLQRLLFLYGDKKYTPTAKNSQWMVKSGSLNMTKKLKSSQSNIHTLSEKALVFLYVVYSAWNFSLSHFFWKWKARR